MAIGQQRASLKSSLRKSFFHAYNRAHKSEVIKKKQFTKLKLKNDPATITGFVVAPRIESDASSSWPISCVKH